MAKKVYLNYGSMNSSKTASLIMTHFNYREQGQNPMILKPSIDNREGTESLVKCRAGLSAGCVLFEQTENLFTLAASLAGAKDRHMEVFMANTTRAVHNPNGHSLHDYKVEFGNSFEKTVDCFLVDEIQFLTLEQVKQLTDIADYLDIPVMCFGLRNDFQSNPFPASAYLQANAEELKETKGMCFCKRKATHVLRVDDEGKVIKEGEQICVGGEDRYLSVCRFHWKAGIYR